jgi:tRNA dimethylallyltransferase
VQILGGLLDEAKQLWDAGWRANSSMATRAIGYRQALQWLAEIQGHDPVSDCVVQQLAFNIQGPSRRLHRKQLVFHRELPIFHWVDASRGPDAVVDEIEASFRSSQHPSAH